MKNKTLFFKLFFGFILSCLILAFFWFNIYYLFIPNPNLKNSESSYLKNHASDLVRWYTWSEDTIKLAKSKNKPLFISIGFATCYSCHIMQKDSFKNPIIAKVINRHFVPILIDKHQMPYVDKLFTELMLYQIGQSGWPMTIMTTPDGIPLFLTLYATNQKLMVSLKRISKDWQKKS